MGSLLCGFTTACAIVGEGVLPTLLIIGGPDGQYALLPLLTPPLLLLFTPSPSPRPSPSCLPCASQPMLSQMLLMLGVRTVFFFRVTGLLRGLASSLDIEYPYLKTMATAALETIKAATPQEERAKSFLFTPTAGEPLPNTALQKKLEAAVTRMHSHDMMKGQIVGMQVAVYHRGERVASVAAGTLGVADPRPVTLDSLFNVFSVTKGVAAAAILLLKQQGKISLDAKVSDYWPEFSAAGKASCTVRHLLNHQAGLADALPKVATLADLTDFEKMADFLASHEPAHKPGAETHYHYLTFGWLVGALAARASGMPLTLVRPHSPTNC